MELPKAQQAAEDVRALLAPACRLLAVAGSIRRGKAACQDIELVAIAEERAARPVFGEPVSGLPPLEARVTDLIRTRQLEYDPITKRNGPKHKRLRVRAYGQWLPVDLFVADPSGENFGNLLTIRTGNAEFSHLLVTPHDRGGLMPAGLRHEGGFLWRGDARLPCPTEEAFFAALGVPPVPPAERTADTVIRLRRSLAAAGEEERRLHHG